MITIITDPIESDLNKKLPIFFPRKVKTGGHRAVRESIINGLTTLKIPFKYNPSSFKELSDRVLVLAGSDTLRQIVKYKQKTKAEFEIAAGPNIVVSPEEHGGFLSYPEVNYCIVPSLWVKEFYESRMPPLKGRVIIWPAGIDVRRWAPLESKNKTNTKNVVFYLKRPIYSHIHKYKKVAEDIGWNVKILDYGKYDLNDYLKILQMVDLVVHFVEQESQGISLLESWSMNVPTYVWNPGYFHFGGSNYESSSAPYLGPETGAFFTNISDFRELMSRTLPLEPRAWVLKNATDEISSINLLNKLNWII